MATNYFVSGAGATALNGTYVENGNYNSKPLYQFGSGSYPTCYHSNQSSQWVIIDDGPMPNYQSVSTSPTPPYAGWTSFMGSNPVPTVAIDGPSLSYSSDTLIESSGLCNAGSSPILSNNIIAVNETSDYKVHLFPGSVAGIGYNIIKYQDITNPDWLLTEPTDILFNRKADKTASTSSNRNNVALANQNLNVSATLADNGTLNDTQTLPLLDGSFATITGGAMTGAGDYALNFDGTDDYVEIPKNPDFDFTTGTIEAWIAPGVSDQSKCFLSMRTTNVIMRWSAHVNQGNGTIGIAWSNNYSAVYVGPITAGRWIHVAIQLGTAICYIYVNGVYKGSTSNGMTASYTGLPLRIGIPNAAYPTEYFLGRIDEVRMWNVTRTEAEIKANMYKEIGIHDNLVAYYKMSGGTGTSLSDNSGNGNTGTLTNGPVWKNSGCFAGPRQTLDFDGTNDYVSIANGVVLGNTFTQEM
jgi:hypothetical protein